MTDAGVKVSEKQALKYLTVFACVSLIAGDVARLPLIVYQRISETDRKRVPNHPIYDVLHNAPNIETNSFQWREASQGHCLLWGNTYSWQERNKYTGDLVALHGTDNPGLVTVKRENNGRISYSWRDWKNRPMKKFRDEMLHVPGFGFNGLTGLSMIQLAREAVGMGLAAEKFGSNYFGQGTHPSGLISLPAEADGMEEDEQKKYLELIRKQYSGLEKSHSLMVLFNGETYKPFTMPPKDAQFLETRDHQKKEICGFYHVPPHKIALHGQNSNYNNLEQENQSYVDSCLMHWLVRWEQCLAHQLLSPEERKQGLYLEFLVDGLLRADSKSRSEFYHRMSQTGAMCPNDIRAKENMNSIEGGDQYFIPLNMIPLDQAEAVAQGNNPPEKNSIEYRGRDGNALQMLSRLEGQYLKPIRTTAQAVVEHEVKSIKEALDEHLGSRSSESFREWLDSFYRQHLPYVRDKFGPVIELFGGTIMERAQEIMGADIGMTPDLEKFIHNYLERYAFDHCHVGKDQLEAIIMDVAFNPDIYRDSIIQRVDEWLERRADKIAADETVRMIGAMTRETWKVAGVKKLTWHAQGSKSCPFCQFMNGKTVGIEENFLEAGDVIYTGPDDDGHVYNEDDPEAIKPNTQGIGEQGGWQALKVYGAKKHPPIHQKCTCKILPG